MSLNKRPSSWNSQITPSSSHYSNHKTSVFVRPSITPLKIPKKSKVNKEAYSYQKSLGMENLKTNFSNIVNISNIVSDKDILDRRNTFKVFLKNKELELFKQNNYLKNSTYFELKKGADLNEFKTLTKVHAQIKSNNNEKGLLFINEFWSDRFYKKIVNDSDLKPKDDMLKLRKKLRLFNEMLKDLHRIYGGMKKFNSKEQSEILDSYFNRKPPKKESPKLATMKRRPPINQNDIQKFMEGQSNRNLDFAAALLNYEKKIIPLEDLFQKLEMFSQLESQEKTQELKHLFKSDLQDNMRILDIGNSKQMNQSVLNRNRLMTHFNLNRHTRPRDDGTLGRRREEGGGNRREEGGMNKEKRGSRRDEGGGRKQTVGGVKEEIESKRESERRNEDEEEDEFNVYTGGRIVSPKVVKKNVRKANESVGKLIERCVTLNGQNDELRRQVDAGIKLKDVEKGGKVVLNPEIRHKKLIDEIETYASNVKKKFEVKEVLKNRKSKPIHELMCTYYYDDDEDDFD